MRIWTTMIGGGLAIQQLNALISQWGGDVTYKVASDVHYAPHQEFGTVHHSAQPYMRPSVRVAESRMSTYFRVTDRGLDAAVAAMARDVRDNSKRRAPVRSGRLRDSIFMEKVN